MMNQSLQPTCWSFAAAAYDESLAGRCITGTAPPKQMRLDEHVGGGMLSVGHVGAAVTALIGREQDSAELEYLLRLPTCQIVTSVGLGGSGKTRLAVAAATTLGHAYMPMVWCLCRSRRSHRRR